MKCGVFFPGGRNAWKITESRVMPKNSMEEHGPKVFSFERGMPSSEKTLTRVESPECGGADAGVTMRKLSRRWRT